MKLTNQVILTIENKLKLTTWYKYIIISNTNNNNCCIVWNKKRNHVLIDFDRFKNTKEVISYITKQLAYTELTLIHGDAWMSRRSKADLKLIVNREAA